MQALERAAVETAWVVAQTGFDMAVRGAVGTVSGGDVVAGAVGAFLTTLALGALMVAFAPGTSSG